MIVLLRVWQTYRYILFIHLNRIAFFTNKLMTMTTLPPPPQQNTKTVTDALYC